VPSHLRAQGRQRLDENRRLDVHVHPSTAVRYRIPCSISTSIRSNSMCPKSACNMSRTMYSTPVFSTESSMAPGCLSNTRTSRLPLLPLPSERERVSSCSCRNAERFERETVSAECSGHRNPGARICITPRVSQRILALHGLLHCSFEPWLQYSQ
jgi:hypothetical protein